MTVDQITIIKEEHIWTSDLKMKHCGYGEWVEEVDELHFEYKGYEARVDRIFVLEPFAKEEVYFGGHLCGYVKIPEDHPYYQCDDIYIECHGGITFNQWDDFHWIGFDCAHLGDLLPSIEYIRKTNPELRKMREMFPLPKNMEDHFMFKLKYRNINFCILECKNIIDQLINSLAGAN